MNPAPGLVTNAPTAQPAPCLGCGAPMESLATAGLHGNPRLRCGYCQREEELPADAAERHRHLRLRLMQVQRARQALEAPLKTYQAVKSSFLMGALFAGVFGAWQLVQVVQNLEQTRKLREVGEAGAYFQSLFFAAVGPALMVGMVLGWVGMSRAFQAYVRPQLQARSPLHPGLAARCRSCGGDLPPIKAAQVTCRYCAADNLLGDALARDASSLLQREAEHYRARAQGEKPDPKAYLRPSQAFYRWGAAGALVTWVLLFGALLGLG